MIKWIQTSRLSIKKSLSKQARFGGEARNFGAILQSVDAFAALVGPDAAETEVGAPRMGVSECGSEHAVTLNPQPSTLNPQPSTFNPQPSTLNPQPSTLNPEP